MHGKKVVGPKREFIRYLARWDGTSRRVEAADARCAVATDSIFGCYRFGDILQGKVSPPPNQVTFWLQTANRANLANPANQICKSFKLSLQILQTKFANLANCIL